MNGGEATASDLSVVRQFLKDNGIDSVPKKGSPLDQLNRATNLPFWLAEQEKARGIPYGELEITTVAELKAARGYA